MLVALLGWGLCLLLTTLVPPAAPLVVAGLVMGLLVGVILSLPAGVLRPEIRGMGMGVFQTCNYALMAGLPALAGRLQDIVGSPTGPLYFATALAMSMVLWFGLFRIMQGRQGCSIAKGVRSRGGRGRGGLLSLADGTLPLGGDADVPWI
jgi:hypothetical protein